MAKNIGHAYGRLSSEEQRLLTAFNSRIEELRTREYKVDHYVQHPFRVESRLASSSINDLSPRESTETLPTHQSLTLNRDEPKRVSPKRQLAPVMFGSSPVTTIAGNAATIANDDESPTIHVRGDYPESERRGGLDRSDDRNGHSAFRRDIPRRLIETAVSYDTNDVDVEPSDSSRIKVPRLKAIELQLSAQKSALTTCSPSPLKSFAIEDIQVNANRSSLNNFSAVTAFGDISQIDAKPSNSQTPAKKQRSGARSRQNSTEKKRRSSKPNSVLMSNSTFNDIIQTDPSSSTTTKIQKKHKRSGSSSKNSSSVSRRQKQSRSMSFSNFNDVSMVANISSSNSGEQKAAVHTTHRRKTSAVSSSLCSTNRAVQKGSAANSKPGSGGSSLAGTQERASRSRGNLSFDGAARGSAVPQHDSSHSRLLRIYNKKFGQSPTKSAKKRSRKNSRGENRLDVEDKENNANEVNVTVEDPLFANIKSLYGPVMVDIMQLVREQAKEDLFFRRKLRRVIPDNARDEFTSLLQ